MNTISPQEKLHLKEKRRIKTHMGGVVQRDKKNSFKPKKKANLGVVKLEKEGSTLACMGGVRKSA